METVTRPNGDAPTQALSGISDGSSYRLGGKGGRSASAWQYVWDNLSRTAFKPGQELASDAAERYGLKVITVTCILNRMASIGVLDQDMIPAPTYYARGKGFTANRRRVHYRIGREYVKTLEAHGR